MAFLVRYNEEQAKTASEVRYLNADHPNLKGDKEWYEGDALALLASKARLSLNGTPVLTRLDFVLLKDGRIAAAKESAVFEKIAEKIETDELGLIYYTFYYLDSESANAQGAFDILKAHFEGIQLAEYYVEWLSF